MTPTHAWNNLSTFLHSTRCHFNGLQEAAGIAESLRTLQPSDKPASLEKIAEKLTGQPINGKNHEVPEAVQADNRSPQS